MNIKFWEKEGSNILAPFFYIHVRKLWSFHQACTGNLAYHANCHQFFLFSEVAPQFMAVCEKNAQASF